MNRYLLVAFFWIASSGVFAQDAATIAAQREAEENQRRMVSRMESLEQANSVQQKRIVELNNDMISLRRQVVEMENKFKNSQLGAVTSADIRKVYDKMAEIEKNRQADNALVKEQFVELKKLLSQPVTPVYVPPEPTRNSKGRDKDKDREKDKDKTPEDEPQAFAGEYYQYKVQPKDNLSGIISRHDQGN